MTLVAGSQVIRVAQVALMAMIVPLAVEALVNLGSIHAKNE